MFDFDIHRETAWSPDLKPFGEDTWEKEPFDSWWSRHNRRLGHLHPLLVEQWVYRHWTNSRLDFLALEDLTWELIEMSGIEVLEYVHRVYAATLYPEHDYKTFARCGSEDKHPTARALDNGTWDYPLVVLKTPSGIISNRENLPTVRAVLVEGHQRHRYLNALHVRGMPPAGPHKVFKISSPSVV